MVKRKLVILILGSILALLGLVACTSADTPTSAATSVNIPGFQPSGGESIVGSQVSPFASQSRGTAVSYSGNQSAGIWAIGRGEITATPDLALLNLGVEAIGDTVAPTNSQAAQAMESVLQALKARGVQDIDIKTRFFNIAPEYRYNDRLRKQELIGYRVSNQVSVKIRDLDNLGQTIDDAVTAGGDLIRIQGVSFTVEDTQALETQARGQAVQDALAKAQQFAQLTGVSVGPLVYIAETGGVIPRAEPFAVRSFEVAVAESVTPISEGEITVTATVQAVFGIQ